MNWNDLKFYLKVTELNNLTDASAALGVSPSTVSRRILMLEKDLGITLFNKRQNGYYATADALSILDTSKEIQAKVDFLERNLKSNKNGEGYIVKIAVPELLGQQLIIPELLNFQKLNPLISFEIENSVNNSKLSTRSSDIVVRYDRPDSGCYKIKKVGQVTRSLYCSKEYLMNHNKPICSSDLSDHFLIAWDKEMRHIPIAKWFYNKVGASKIWMTTSNFNSQLLAVTEGLGIAALPKFAAMKYDLVPLLNDEPSLISEIFLMKNEESYQFKSVKLLADFIESIIQTKADTLF